MPASATQGEDRTRLDGFELEIFKLVRETTSEQWREWLRAPLEHAAADGNKELFTRLMDAGADGNAGWRGCHGRTLLGAAAYGQSEEIAMAVLNAGAKDEVNVKFGRMGESALHVAAEQGSERVTNALMLAGANPNILDNAKHSPLHVAAQAGHDGVVSILLLKGADPNVPRMFGLETPLHLAAWGGHGLCVSKLVAGGANKDTRRDMSGLTPLITAALQNHLGAVEELLAAGADFDLRRDPSSFNALDIAAKQGYVDVVRALLRHGSCVSSSDERGYTVLHYCCEVDEYEPHEDNGDVINMLLEAGASIEAKTTDDDAYTPLHLAANQRMGSSGTFRALLDCGANVNARDAKDGTPLHDACGNSCVVAVEALLRRGADERLTQYDGETAEDMVGEWEGGGDYYVQDDYEEEDYEEKRKADDQLIRHMLARAPADRSWRRRGWLVLARSCPAKVQLAHDNDSRSSSSSRDETVGLAHLIGRVVGMDAEGVFRLVVGFL